MPTPIEHHYTTLNGYKAHYASCGEPDKPLLLCVHGFPEGWFAWRGVMQALAKHYYVVAPDTRGINESEGPDETSGYRVANMVSDLLALLDHLGRRRCYLAGHDWGGAIACAFAIAHPERLHRLVMINSTHPGVFLRELATNPAQRAASTYIGTLLQPDAEAILGANDHAWIFGMLADAKDGKPPAWLDATLRDDYVRSWSAKGSLRAGLSYYRASQLTHSVGTEPGAPGASFDDEKLKVRVRTLFIWGELDRFLLTGCIDGLDRYFPEVEIERLPDAGHWIIHERGTRVAELLSRFIGERAAI